jgi:hypothetical protein
MTFLMPLAVTSAPGPFGPCRRAISNPGDPFFIGKALTTGRYVGGYITPVIRSRRLMSDFISRRGICIIPAARRPLVVTGPSRPVLHTRVDRGLRLIFPNLVNELHSPHPWTRRLQVFGDDSPQVPLSTSKEPETRAHHRLLSRDQFPSRALGSAHPGSHLLCAGYNLPAMLQLSL